MRRQAMLLLLLVAGCSTSPSVNPPPPPPPPPGPPPPPPSPGVVQVRNNSFNPEVVTVSVGGTVRWEWTGQGHNVTSVLSPSFGPNSATQSAPFTHGPLTFNQAGSYRYICGVHGFVSGSTTSGMRGSVVVQ